MPEFQDFGSVRFVRALGKIDEVKFGLEDHGMFGFHLGVNFGGSHGGTGWFTVQKEQIPVDGSLLYTQLAILECFGVDEWSQLKGKVIWALFEKDDPYNSSVKGFMRPEFDGTGQVIFDDIYEGSRRVRQERENRLTVEARKGAKKLVAKADLEKVLTDTEAMLLQGADRQVAREWAEEIVADVLKVVGVVAS
jgi:hypothetical protein